LTRFGPGRIFSEYGTVTTAEVLASYSSGPTAGSPAVTRRAVGTGVAYYVGTSLDPAGLAEFLGVVAAERSIVSAPGASDTFEIVSRSSGDRSWTFLINHGDEARDIDISGVELLSGTVADGSLTVGAGQVAVVRVDAS
jgi:beta-galactosidase